MEGHVDHIRTTPCPSKYCCTLVFMCYLNKLETLKTNCLYFGCDKLEGMQKSFFYQNHEMF
jgi:hypothetical protein